MFTHAIYDYYYYYYYYYYYFANCLYSGAVHVYM